MENDSKNIASEVRKKLLLDLVTFPPAFFTFLAGTSLLMLYWATMLPTFAAVLGFFSCVIGFGIGVTNFLFNVDKFSVKALDYVKDLSEDKLNQRLDLLQANLKKTVEKSDDKYLRQLRKVYMKFCEDIETKKLVVSSEIVIQFEQIFQECVKSLEHSFDLHETAKTLFPKKRRAEIQVRRRQVLEEVSKSLDLLSEIATKSRTILAEERENRLASMREDLSNQLQLAELANERMKQIEEEINVNRVYE